MKHVRGEEPIGDRERSWEYGSWIIEAREKDQPFRIHGNVPNNVGGAGALITNLPADGCVEVACLIDQNGINPTRYGKLPPQMAALCDSNMRIFDLAATGDHRAQQGSRHPRADARPALRRRVQPRRDQGNDAGAVRRREGLPAGVQVDERRLCPARAWAGPLLWPWSALAEQDQGVGDGAAGDAGRRVSGHQDPVLQDQRGAEAGVQQDRFAQARRLQGRASSATSSPRPSRPGRAARPASGRRTPGGAGRWRPTHGSAASRSD